MTLLGNQISIDIINKTDILIGRGNLDIDTHIGRMPHEDEGRVLVEASVSQGTPRITSKSSQERHGTNFLSYPFYGINPVGTLTLGL